MNTRRNRIGVLIFCLFGMPAVSCWETGSSEVNVEITPREVSQGKTTAVAANSNHPAFFENDYEVAIYPDDGVKIGTLKRGSTKFLNIPLEVAADAPLGPRVLAVRYGDSVVETEIDVQEGENEDSSMGDLDLNSLTDRASRLSILPNRVSRGERVKFKISGEQTSFTDDTTVRFGPNAGIEINEVEVQSSTLLSLDATVSMGALPGTRTLYVSGPSGQSVDVLAVDLQVMASVTCYNDAYEVNNDIGNAKPLNFPAYAAASICAGDHDYFKVNIQAGVSVDFRILFAHADGNLDMELLTLQGQVLGTAYSWTDNEIITFTVPPHQSGERVLHIFGRNNAINNYTFIASVSGSTCTDDSREPNDIIGSAIPISFPDTFSAMLCSNDDDFFMIQVPGAMTIDVSTQFTHAAGDLNLALLSSTGTVLATSESTDDDEHIEFTTGGPQTLLIRVYGINGDENSYTLSVAEQTGDTESDIGGDTDSDTFGDTDTEPPPVCPKVRFAVEPSYLSVGRYSARLTLTSEKNPDWTSDNTEVLLPDAPDNVFLEGCTVTTSNQISCNITVGLFALPGDIRLDVQNGTDTPVCGVLTIEPETPSEAVVPQSVLPALTRQEGELDAADHDRSDFFHIHPQASDLLVFHAVSLDRENMDPVLRLITGDGNGWLVYKDDETPLGIDSRIAYYFAAAGDYYVEVGPKFADTFGDYQFYLYRLTHGRTVYESGTFNDVLESAEMITPQVPYVIHGAISDENDIDVYQIAVDRPVAVDVAARRLGPWDDALADVSIAVYDINHQVVAKNATWFEAPTSADPRVFLPGAGNYFVEVVPAKLELSDIEKKHTGFYAVNVREQLVINEIDNRITTDEPFVELLGPPDFDLSGYVLQIYDEAGEPAYAAPGLSLDGLRTDAAGYGVIGAVSQGAGPVLLSSGPGAAVLTYNAATVDAVQFGVPAGAVSFAEAHPAEVGVRRSIGRGAGIDTNNNDLDFIHMANPTPGAPNDRTFMSPVPLYGESDGCHNLKKDGTESDVDCGGLCTRCDDGKRCDDPNDCLGGRCDGGICIAGPSCTDMVQNQDEADVDCGGVCPKCPMGATCEDDIDCQTNNCEAGICGTVETCDDGLLNQDESDVDCGGIKCDACDNGRICTEDLDCESGFCDGGICDDPETCTDGIKNQNESDVDCGGVCPGCADGGICTLDTDCASGDCALGRCVRLTGSITYPNLWTGGYCASLRIRNNSQTAINTWRAVVGTRGFVPYSTWNIAISGAASPYTFTPLYDWNRVIAPGAAVDVGGWCANVSGSNWQPFVVSVRGE